MPVQTTDWRKLADLCALAWCWEMEYGEANRAEIWSTMGHLAEERLREMVLWLLTKED